MPDLQKYPAKRCLTSVGMLIHDHKILMIKHKKAGFWLPPGGHVDEGELPHIAAAREFWEETNISVQVINAIPLIEAVETEYLPMPFACNLHWINKQNYEQRVNQELKIDTDKRLCEQHYTWIYLVRPLDMGKLEVKQNVEETDGIEWFGLSELAKLETSQDVKAELRLAFELTAKLA